MARRRTARPTRPTHPTRTVPTPRTPAFLAASESYAKYITKVPLGHVRLPVYEKDSRGAVIIHPGEVYCRVPDCRKGKEALSSTTALRTHVHGHHHIRVAMNPPGSLSSEQKESTKAFFRSIFEPAAAGQG